MPPSYPESTGPAHNAKWHIGTWDDETRKHEAMKWMETYTRDLVDQRYWEEPAEKWHTSDFSVQKPNGEYVKGADAAWKTIAQLYAPFAAFRHEPNFLIYWDYVEGKEWGMVGSADVWYRLQGLSGDAVTDKEGNKWDAVNSAAFIFHYVKQDDGGIKLKSTRIFADVGPTFKLMLEKGMLDAETLKGIVIGS